MVLHPKDLTGQFMSSSSNSGVEGACVATSDYFIIGSMIIVANIQDMVEASVVGRC